VAVTYHLRYRGTSFPIRLTETTIGRSHYCPIVLANPLASRQHAKLTFEDGELHIVDLGSSNGTRVNGELITGRRKLSAADVISVGSDLLEVVEAQARGDSALPRLDDDDDDDAPSTGRALGNKTSVQSSLQLIEGLVANARESSAPANLAVSVRRAVDQYLRDRRQQLGAREALRLAAAVDGFRAAFPDGSADAWCATAMAAIQPHLNRRPPPISKR
jgi:pSer/pThr/pTyr-binding forkhead associated (FHA) protein